MSDKVAWGVFKGLFGFFVILPIALVMLFFVLVMFAAAFEGATSRTTSASESKPTPEAPAVSKQKAEYEAKKLQAIARKSEEQEQLRQLKEQQEEKAREQRIETLRVERQQQAEKLFERRKQRALQGSLSASFDLGLMYLNGQGTETNLELGLKYIRTAANGGDAQAVNFFKNFKQ